ncbi:hypothetical protein [Paraglaciecola marina]|uniref:hypothetical protein n=1 Tax=Paraglaciecola marina TaxID=2500157 RepID=UPI00105FED7E|nr:hypothetical protein [Paraglaciecola marina]
MKFTALLCIVGLTILGFYSNEARKEVYFLCGNFTQGVSYLSVTKQLDTTHLSTYTIEKLQLGKRIVHSSWLNLHLVKCNINFNNNDLVVSAFYESP